MLSGMETIILVGISVLFTLFTVGFAALVFGMLLYSIFKPPTPWERVHGINTSPRKDES